MLMYILLIVFFNLQTKTYYPAINLKADFVEKN